MSPRQASPDWISPQERRVDRKAAILIVAWTALIGAVAVWRVWGLEADSPDLGFAVHALAAVARGGPLAPASWAGWSYLEDHFSPLMLVLAPLAATSWGGYWLVAAQASAFGASVFVAWRLAGLTVPDRVVRGMLVAAYATAPAALFALLFDVHGNVMAVPFVMTTLYGLIAGRPAWTVAGGIGACLLREDAAFAVLLIGLAYSRRGQRYALVLAMAAVICLAVWRLLPIGPGYANSYGYVDLNDPLGTLSRIPGVVWSHGAVVFLPIVVLYPWVVMRRMDWRPLAVLAAISIPYLLAASPNLKVISFHYWVLAPVLMFAAVVTQAARATSRTKLAFVLAAALLLVEGPFVTAQLGPAGPSIYRLADQISARSSFVRASHAAIRCIDPNSTVALPIEASPLTGHFVDVRVLPHPFEPLVGTDGRTSRVMRPAESTRPDFLITAYLPAVVTGYTRSSVNHLVWARGGEVPVELERCLAAQ